MLRSMVALTLAGCAGATPAPEGPTPGPGDELAALEAALLDAESIALPFAVEAEGAVTVGLEGELRFEGPMVRLTATGTFAGEAVELELRADEASLYIGEEEQPRPPRLKEALVLGMTRMGILHNLARLVSGQAPDHSDTGVEPWLAVQVRRADPFVFDILVEGERVAEAELAVAEGLPVSRRQTVAFPDGEMRVRETYGGAD